MTDYVSYRRRVCEQDGLYMIYCLANAEPGRVVGEELVSAEFIEATKRHVALIG